MKSKPLYSFTVTSVLFLTYFILTTLLLLPIASHHRHLYKISKTVNRPCISSTLAVTIYLLSTYLSNTLVVRCNLCPAVCKIKNKLILAEIYELSYIYLNITLLENQRMDRQNKDTDYRLNLDLNLVPLDLAPSPVSPGLDRIQQLE